MMWVVHAHGYVMIQNVFLYIFIVNNIAQTTHCETIWCLPIFHGISCHRVYMFKNDTDKSQHDIPCLVSKQCWLTFGVVTGLTYNAPLGVVLFYVTPKNIYQPDSHWVHNFGECDNVWMQLLFWHFGHLSRWNAMKLSPIQLK